MKHIGLLNICQIPSRCFYYNDSTTWTCCRLFCIAYQNARDPFSLDWAKVSSFLGPIPSAVVYQPTLPTDLGGLQERITTTKKGEKYELAKKIKRIKLVWLEDCLSCWRILPKSDYNKSGYELEMENEAKDFEDETKGKEGTQYMGKEANFTPQCIQTAPIFAATICWELSELTTGCAIPESRWR